MDPTVLPDRLTFAVIRGQVAGCERTVAVPVSKLRELWFNSRPDDFTDQWLASVWPVEQR